MTRCLDDIKEQMFDYIRAIEKSEEHLEKDTRKYGGNPLPGEPGWERYFEKVETNE